MGVQYIRTAAILQLLLGNIGRPGGGILALRGHASIQGSTDIPTLFDLLPGYLPMPHVHGNEDLATYVDAESTDKGFWADMRSYMVSLLKAWWGEAATADNDFCYDYLPRLTGSHSTYETVVAQIAGDCPGYFLFGENPAVGSANGRMQRFGLANLDWLVVRDLVLIESATFWKNGPEIETGEMRTEDIGTEVFFLPAAAHTEKNGRFTNTQRMLQWHHEAVEPAGDARSDLWFAYHLGRRIREKLAASADEMDRPVQDLTWDYPVEGPLAEPSAEAVLAEVNGWDADGKPLSSYTQLKDDGSTACGCWIYCGVRADGVNQAARRKPGSEQSWVAPEWGWAWPLNRRILYNRASADPDGKPWSERKALVWWDADAGKWTGHDVRRLHRRPAAVLPAARRTPPAWTRSPASTRSSCRPTARAGCSPRPAWWTARCPRTTSRRSPRSPTRCTASSATRSARSSGTRGTRSSRPAANSAPRCSPTSPPPTGSPSITPPAACRACCPICPSCSRSSSARSRPSWPPSGAWSTRAGPRSSPRAPRSRPGSWSPSGSGPIEVQGRRLHQIGLPYHWGGNGLTTGDSANDLAHLVLDPNVHIQEVKAMACDIRPGRRPRGPALRRAGARVRASGRASPTTPARRCDDASTLPPARATSTIRRGWASSPTPRSASGARPARWPARSGTRCPRTASACPGCPTTTPSAWARRPGGTWPSSSSPRPVPPAEGVRWLMSSDVCKHCTESACLDVCPTGALFRTEFGTVVVQDDVCNGCGYCVPACPFGVIARREEDGQAHKCTLCYDRLGAGLEPACAKACPTQSIQFGPLDELRERARLRVEDLHAAGQDQARLYLDDPADGIGGGGAFFLLLDEPEVYGLPPDPVVTTRDLPGMWKHVAIAAAGLAATAVALGLGGRR